MKVSWWLTGCLSFLLALPAEAGQLQFWRFEPNRNRLEFVTEQGVQPRAKLLADPTRLVIDLPGIVLGQPTVTQTLGQAIRSVRVGQFDPQTTRVVIELMPGYTLDPQQIRFRGESPRQWSVQLPPPQRSAVTGVSEPARETEVIAESKPSVLPGKQQQQPATIQGVDLGGSQLLIRADQPLRYRLNQEGDRYRITLTGAQLAEQVRQPRLGRGSPLTQFDLQQEDEQTVVILVQPAPGVAIGELVQLNPQSLLLQLSRSDLTPTPINPTPAPQPIVRPASQDRPIVVIDPGHGGTDPGAVGIGGLRETDVVLPISLEVAQILQQQGMQVHLTRRDERTLDLGPRVALAARLRADLFVSIHANAISMSRPDVNGVETFHAPGATESRRLATAIQRSILGSFNMRDRGVKAARFFVLARSAMPAVLVEVGFVTGREDAPKLADPGFRSQMAAAIARGILQYLQRQ